MAIAPGTVIPSGTQVSPGGDIGMVGPAGAPGVAGASEEVGSIKSWPSVTPPPAWMLIDGSAISRTLYPKLFSLIGTSFGPGDGSTTFNLPDGRSRFILNYGQGASLSLRNLGDIGGEEQHILTLAEIVSHTHPIAAGQFSHTHPLPNFGVGQSAGSGFGTWLNQPSTATGAATLPAGTAGASGGGGAHNTMGPFLCLVYIIKVSPTGGDTAQAPIADQTQAGLLNILSGNATDYVGGDNQCHPLLAPTIEYYDQDDFGSMVGTTTNVWNTKLAVVSNSGGAGAVTAAWPQNWPGHIGMIQLAPGTVSGNWARILVNFFNFFLDGNLTASIGGVVLMLPGSFTSVNQFFFGLANSAGPPLAATNFYVGFFAAASSGANWFYHCRNAATSVLTDSGVPAIAGGVATWFKFRIDISSTQIDFYINDNFVGSILSGSGAIPVATQILNMCFFTNNSTGTTNSSLIADCMDIWLKPVPQAGQSPTRFMRRIL